MAQAPIKPPRMTGNDPVDLRAIRKYLEDFYKQSIGGIGEVKAEGGAWLNGLTKGAVLIGIAANTVGVLAPTTTAHAFLKNPVAGELPEWAALTLDDLPQIGTHTLIGNAADATTAPTAISYSPTFEVANDALTIAPNQVTNAQLAQVATARIKGRHTAATGNVEDLTGTQATALLDAFVGDSGTGGTKGLVPAPPAGAAAALKYLDASGVFSVPGGGSAPGNVVGPASATDNNVAIYNGSTGKIIKDGGKGLPSGAIVGDTDSQTISNKVALRTGTSTAYGSTGSTIQANSSGTDAGLSINDWDNAAHNPFLEFNLSRSNTIGTQAAVGVTDILGSIKFRGSDGAAFQTAAQISGRADGTVSSGIVSGKLAFFTVTAAGALTQALVIDNAQIGTASALWKFPGLLINGTGGNGYIEFPTQASPPTAPPTGFRKFGDASGRFSWIRASDGFIRTLDSTLTANRVFTLPDAAGTIALTANKLSAFAATTSAELAGVISDETGSGALAFGTGPSLSAVAMSGTWTGSPTFSGDPAFSGQPQVVNGAYWRAVRNTSSTAVAVLGFPTGSDILEVRGSASVKITDTSNNQIALFTGAGGLLVGTGTDQGAGKINAQNGYYVAGSALNFTNLAGSVAAAQMPALTGDVTTSAGAVATTIGVGKVTNAMLAGSIAYSKLSLTGAILNADLAGSIAYSKLSLTGAILNADLAGSIAASKLVGSDIATVGTITSGIWHGTTIAVANGGTGVTIRPSFAVTCTSSTSVNTATFTKVPWNVETTDIGGNFDSATNFRFTVPTGGDGRYVIGAQVAFSSVLAGAVVICAVYKNGSGVKWGRGLVGAIANTGVANVSIVIDLVAADFIEIYAYHEHGSARSLTGSGLEVYFSGSLLA